MKKRFSATLIMMVLILALLPTIGGCGSTTGQTSATIYGTGSDKMTAQAKLVDQAIGGLQKSTSVGKPVTISDGVLTVGCDTAYPPLEYLAKVITLANNKESVTTQMVGFEVDLSYAAAKKLGLTVEFVQLDWSNLSSALAEGRVDMLASGMATGSALKGEVKATDTYLAADLAICTKKGVTLADKASLKGKLVGVQLGSAAETLTKTVEGVTEVRSYPHILGAFADLKSGKLDAVVAEDPICRWLLANNPDYTAQLAVSGSIVTGEGYAFWCKSDNAQLLAALNGALGELRTDQIVIQDTTPTTAATATSTTVASTAVTPTTSPATQAGATTTSTVVPQVTKSVYQLICEKWGLTGN